MAEPCGLREIVLTPGTITVSGHPSDYPRRSPREYDLLQFILVTEAATALSRPPQLMAARSGLSRLSREELVRIARSARGMWADREDIGDTVEYVSRLRASWERRMEDLGIG
jgi:hypothetical protein